jgi:hypothetical protein
MKGLGMRVERRSFRLATVVYVLMVFGLTPILPIAWSQEPVFDYLDQAVDNLTVHPSSANLTDHDCFSNGSCIFGVSLNTGNYHEITANFDENVDYLIFGAGDDRILELDLKLISSNGVLRLQDGTNDAFPALQFSPGTSGEMRLRVTNVDSLGAGFSVMLILEENDAADFSLNQVREAFDNLASTSIAGLLTASRFARETFCLFGGRLREGQSNFLYNTKPGAGDFALVGAGSDNVDDVDIFVYRQIGLDSASSRLIARDAESNNHPSSLFTVESGYYYLIRHKNRTSRDDESGFVLSVLLQNSP